MPPVTRVYRAGDATIPVETVNTLHSELAAIGLQVRGTEASGTPTFGTETQARVRDFQKLYHLPETGDVDPDTGGVMSIASLVATNTDKAKLSASLRSAENAVSGSQLYNDRLARAALLAGDYELAKRVSPHLTDLSGMEVNLGAGVLSDGSSPGSPRQPEVPFPENFYSYQYNLMAQEDIDDLRSKMPAGSTPRLARVMARPNTDSGSPTLPPTPPQGVPEPPPATGTTREDKLTASALAFLDALETWQVGNAHFSKQRYAGAIQSYNQCQQAILDYFSLYPDYNLQFTTSTLSARVDELIWHIASERQTWSDVWAPIEWRRQLLSLAELGQFDWTPITGGRYAHIVYQLLEGNLAGSDQPPPPTNPIGPEHRKIMMDTHLLVMAAVLVPLARGEANRLQRQYASAKEDFSRVLRNSVPVPNANSLFVPAILRCEFIETPFVRLLLAETMLDQAEAEYKARVSLDDEPDQTLRTQELGRTTQIAQDLTNRHIPGDPRPGAQPLQHLVAAITYTDAMESMKDDGEYVARAKQALDDLQNGASPLDMTVPTIKAADGGLPGLTSGTSPHEPYLKFQSPNGQPMRECNPRVYALLLQAQARLLQIWNGFNYIGYRDDYTPPWRFQFLLDRARYFSEHAKNAQRDYLNFLNNAENEEFKEMSAAQNVELEKSNVQIETAKVDQASKEVAASKESVMLAQVNMDDARQRVENYREFDAEMSVFEDVSLVGSFINAVVTLNPGQILDATTGVDKAWAERELEKNNLQLAIGEADQAGKVALAQLDVAKAGLVVAGLQRQAALLRHEFALQNLQFMRNQTLNTEQWYRLAGAIRSVGDTYLRYAIELAFLAQQAYNFESDKRLNVIRFDYDLSDVGAMLAADFLLRDLDGLEQDLIAGQESRQQQVRYVLSMAREFPETLRSLAEKDWAIFSMRLEQLERRFPGLANLRISSVDLQPQALMDATRFSVELTHLGTGMVRLKAQPGSSPLNSTDLSLDGDWLKNVENDWPVKIHPSGPETAVFSGLSRQEAASLSSITANERSAFEDLPGASAWKIDMSMKENRVVPNSLADVLITFTLSGYYDASLRDVIDHTPRKPLATTTWFSGHQLFPDAYYQFNRTGQMDWQISSDLLALQGTLGDLQNIGVLCVLSQKRPELGRIACSYPVEFEVDSTGAITVTREFPKISFSANGLSLNISLTSLTGSTVTFDFGDGTGLVDSSALPHTYGKPGRYDVLIRINANGRLTEYMAAVVVSRQQTVLQPCVAIPDLHATVAGTQVKVQPGLQVPSGETLAVSWRIDGVSPDPNSNPLSFTLDLPEPGKKRRYVLRFSAVRILHALFYSQQRYEPTTLLLLDGLYLATNRTFEVDTGNENTTSLNAFGQHVFGGPALSPTDRWTMEFPLDDDHNQCLASVSSVDTKQYDLGELTDILLTLEYKIKDE